MQCAGDPEIKYTIRKADGTEISSTTETCPEDETIYHGPIEEPGLYEITATIPGCTTIECRKTTTFNVFEETPEETAVPETSSLIVIALAFVVLAVIRKTKG